ncbi:MAG: hypothetical protein QOG03_539 [Actinomycetota bacterium]|jgi:hypothetical protein|nr:hypothetical protein [Actinomycetota bacterium]
MNGYVSLGYGVTLATLAVYTLRLMARSRALSKVLAPELAPRTTNSGAKTEGEAP